ncbi:MAG TPA: hypothetical protein VFB32_17125 [Rudaea sp.]|nr:hypothetical protein [Rudaea sp.]
MLADGERRRVLAAMGVDVYVRRAAGREIAPVAAGEVDLVVACAGDAARTPAAGRLREALPRALGLAADRVRWIEADMSGTLPAPPEAPAYLALGAAMPRALGVHMSTMQQNSAIVAVADAPAACLGSAAGKRALWQALRPIARRLAHGAQRW